MAKGFPFLLDIGPGLSLALGLPTISSWKIKDRPKKPKLGTFGYNSETSRLEYWDGSSWFGASMSK